MKFDSRIRKCSIHSLRPRCPACELERRPDGNFRLLEVPIGTAEWLREAARYFDAMGTESAVDFVQWVVADLREVAVA